MASSRSIRQVSQSSWVLASARGRCRERVEALAAGRRMDVRPLTGSRNAYRLRIGAYRVIFRREGDTLIIEDIAPRGGAY